MALPISTSKGFLWKQKIHVPLIRYPRAPWATLVQNVVFSYVLPYVVKFGETRWDKWLACGENIYHFKHSSKFWLRGYLWFSFNGPLKLLNKRLRPKHEFCNNSVIFDRFGWNLVCRLLLDPRFHWQNFSKVTKARRFKVARSKANILKS